MKNFYKTKNGKIGIIVTIILIIIIAIVIGVVSGTKSSSKTNPWKPITPSTTTILTAKQVANDITNYLKGKTWYYITDQTKITFTLDGDIKGSSGKWIAILDPSKNPNSDPKVNLSLNWTTKAKDSDITTQIGNQKYSTTPPKPPTNNLTAKDVANDIKAYLTNDNTPWYYNKNPTQITFTLDGDIKGSSGKWIAILDPSKNPNSDPKVNLSLNWTTKAKDSDITTQIGNQKYYNNGYSIVTESDIYNKYDALITGNSNSKMIISNNSIAKYTNLKGTLSFTPNGFSSETDKLTIDFSNYLFNKATITTGVKISNIPIAPDKTSDPAKNPPFALDSNDLPKHVLVFDDENGKWNNIPSTQTLAATKNTSYFVALARTKDNKLIIWSFILHKESEVFTNLAINFTLS